jgi:hypothetical protein
MTKSFEDFLKEKHAENYTGVDDDMPDAFDHWLGQLDGQEYMDYAQEWGEITQSGIGALRQWLNEDRITDPKKMVTNEDICRFLNAFQKL